MDLDSALEGGLAERRGPRLRLQESVVRVEKESAPRVVRRLFFGRWVNQQRDGKPITNNFFARKFLNTDHLLNRCLMNHPIPKISQKAFPWLGYYWPLVATF